LIVVAPDDEFYAAALPLPKVRYCFINPAATPPPHYTYLGISVTGAQFAELELWEPRFRSRLALWKLDSGDPIATAILARSEPDVLQLIAARPHADFYLPAGLRAAAEPMSARTHRVSPVSASRFFLLAREIPHEHRALAPAWKPSGRW
jgi:hypothetical protein